MNRARRIGPFAIGWLKGKLGSYAGGLYVVGATLAVSVAVTLLLSRPRGRQRATPSA
jgi:ACS family tartrate transporter-like MFS transporter